MSITSFRFSLLPKANIELANGGEVPEELPEYKAVYDISSFSLEEENLNYWEGLNTNCIEKSLSEFLPKGKSWSPEEMSVYENNFCEVEVWQDDVNIKFEASDPDYELLKKIVMVAAENKCIFVITETGRIIPANFEILLDELHSSKAFRFKLNPDKVLSEYQAINRKK